MNFLLGVDGGGTGCRAVLADASGRVLGEGRAGAANIATDLDGSRTNILLATGQAIAGTGVTLTQLQAVLGLAGANVPPYATRLAAQLPFAAAQVVSDAVIAFEGALGQGDGVVATLGTGSVFAGRRGGQFEQIGGWGFVLGDEASGAWLGRALLARALLAEDGLAPASPLLAEIVTEAGGARALPDFANAARPGDFGRYAPRLLASADPAAQEILAEADAHVLRAIDRLAGSGPLPVCFLGGLGPAYAARLAPRLGSRIVAPKGTALDGALALARSLSPGGLKR